MSRLANLGFNPLCQARSLSGALNAMVLLSQQSSYKNDFFGCESNIEHAPSSLMNMLPIHDQLARDQRGKKPGIQRGVIPDAWSVSDESAAAAHGMLRKLRRDSRQIKRNGRRSVGTRQGELYQERLQDDPRFEGTSPLISRSAFEEHGGSWPTRPGPRWACCFLVFWTAKGGMSGEPAGFGETREPCGPEVPGVVQLEQAGTHGRQERCTGSSPAVRSWSRCSSASRTWPRQRSIQGLPDRLHPASSDELDDVIPFDSLRLAGVNRQLLDFRRQDAGLRAHELDQKTRSVGSSWARWRVRASRVSQGASSLSRGLEQSIDRPAFSTSFARIVVASHCLA